MVYLIFALAVLQASDAVYTVTREEPIQPSFKVDYENNQFLKDGQPFRYVSGSLHYFRVPRAYWRDRMRKMRAAGLNTLCTYIEWSSHEKVPGSFDFSGQNDVVEFINTARQEGLVVIIRPGPYICSERDLGGYPVWLYHEKPNMILRTSDLTHRKYVSRWFTVLLPKMQPLLYGNGGPIIMVQVENEYGSYFACDRNYTLWLRDELRGYVEDSAVLFTTDGSASSFLRCGPIPGVLATVDFGPGAKNISEMFDPLRKIQNHGPLVNSEFYPGWLTHWGDETFGGNMNITKIVNSTRQLLLLNASFNFYMFCGGTDFDFSNGANSGHIDEFEPSVTSYDFGAPISESGNLTEKYFAIRSVISEFLPIPEITTEASKPAAYGPVMLEPKVSLFDSNVGIPYGQWAFPRTFEELGLYTGLLWYETALPAWYEDRGYLEANNTHDRAIVFIDKKIVGVLSRTDNQYAIILEGKGGRNLGLLVENQGHINYGSYMLDIKGLLENVTLNGEILVGWNHTGYPLDNLSEVFEDREMEKGIPREPLPSFYIGHFNIQGTIQDTFVDMWGWTKGFLYVNGHNIGRYWPREGPQITLYLPAPFLKAHNTVLVLELESSPSNKTIRLVDAPILKQSSTTNMYSGRDTLEDTISVIMM